MSDNEFSDRDEGKITERIVSDSITIDDFDRTDYSGRKRKERQKYSSIWSKFTVYNDRDSIATCNICGVKLSFKTTVSNLKKHVERKHNYNTSKHSPSPYQPKRKNLPTKRPNLSELSGLDGLILNVVADEGEDPHLHLVEQEVEASEVYQSEGHDYCVVTNNLEENSFEQTEESQRNTEHDSTRDKTRPTQQTRHMPRIVNSMSISDRGERIKRNRIMDLQLECLEIKKYNMQMEALMMEHQLSLPRSIFTETLRNSDTITRGTQTDVGGNNTKVFYVSDGKGLSNGSHHLLAFQSMLDD